MAITILDSAGVTKTVKTTDNAGTHTPHHNIDDISAGTQTNDVKVTLDSEVVSVDDNGGSLTIDHSALNTIHYEDYDTGAGNDSTAAVGIVAPGSGGPVPITGDNANGLDVDVTRVGGTVTVSGTVTANAGTNLDTSGLALETGGNLADAKTAVETLRDTTLADVPNVLGTTGAAGPSKALSIAGTRSTGELDEIRTDSDGHLQIDVINTVAVSASELTDIETNTDSLAVTGGGVQAGALRVTIASDSSGVISVDDNGSTLSVDDGGGNISVDDGGGSLTIDGTVTANLGATDNAVLDSIDTAVNTLPSAQAEADWWDYASAAAVADTNDDEVQAAVVGEVHYVTGIQVFNGSDSVGTEVVIKDGATVMWRGWAEQTGGGCSAQFNPPLKGTANTALNVANITTASATYFNLQGYTK